MDPLESAVDIVTLLVSFGGYIDARLSPRQFAVSPLHFAVSHDSSLIISALLSSRLKFPDTVSRALSEDDCPGYTPLLGAISNRLVSNRCFECCQLLVEAGADVCATPRDWMSGELRASPLEEAVIAPVKDLLQLFLQSPSCQVDKVGSMKAAPLLLATRHGSIVVVR